MAIRAKYEPHSATLADWYANVCFSVALLLVVDIFAVLVSIIVRDLMLTVDVLTITNIHGFRCKYKDNEIINDSLFFICFFNSCQKPTSPTTMISAHFYSHCAPPSRSSRCMNKLKMSTLSACCNSAAALRTMCMLTTNFQRCCPSLKKGCKVLR